MTTKKYLTTVEEILALKDTGTKIYSEDHKGYHQFVQGTLCYFDDDGSIMISSEFGIGEGFARKYILVEEPVKDADENDIGKLCKFWSDDPSQYMVGILYEVDEEGGDCRYCMDCSYGCWCAHCHPLSPAEVAEITGYKVEE